MLCRSCKTTFHILPRSQAPRVVRSFGTESHSVFVPPPHHDHHDHDHQRARRLGTSAPRATKDQSSPASLTATEKDRLGSLRAQLEHKRDAGRAAAAAAEASTQHESRGKKARFLTKLLTPVAETIAYNAPGAMQTYAVYGATEDIYKQCAAQADYRIGEEVRREERLKLAEDGEEIGVSVAGGVWHEDFGLLPTFSTWAQVTMLHLWLVVTRLRMVEPESFRTWQDTLVNHFFHGAEAKMEVEHALTSSMRQRYLKDLFVQWRGAVLSYDEGLVRGDAALAAAVWRNLFKARGDVDARVLAAVVAWMRRALVALERTRDEALREVWRPMVGTSPKMELPGVDKPVRELEELYKELGL